MVAGNLQGSPSMILRSTWRRILPERVFGSLSTTNTFWKQATGPISFRISAISCFSIPSRAHPVLITTNPIGISPFSSSILATTAASETEGCEMRISSMAAVERRWPAVLMMSSRRVITLRQPSLSKQPASPVVQQPGVSVMYFSRKAWSLLQSVLMKEGGMGSRMHTLPELTQGLPRVFMGTFWFWWLMISTTKPGAGLVAEPGLEGKVKRSWQLQEMIQPISVCQQLSLIITFSLLRIHSQVGISQRSPAIDTPRKDEMLYLSTQSPLLSSFRIARSPVGLVYSPFTLYFSTIAHNAPGLGMVGLPSQSTVAAPTNSGPQMVKLWPTTQPMSLEAKQISLRPMPMIWRMVQARATVVPPWSRTMPFGAPVVPEVQRMQRQSVLFTRSAGRSSKIMLSTSNCSQLALQGTSRPGRCRMSTCGLFPEICRASLRISTQLTFLLGSRPQLVVTMAVGVQSTILLANYLAANPPKTMECTAPRRAQAQAAKSASGIIGMQMITRSPLPTPLDFNRWPILQVDSQAWRTVQVRSWLTMLETQTRACLSAWAGRKRSNMLCVMLTSPSGYQRAKAGSRLSRMVLGKENHSTSRACSSQYCSRSSAEAALRNASSQAFSAINQVHIHSPARNKRRRPRKKTRARGSSASSGLLFHGGVIRGKVRAHRTRGQRRVWRDLQGARSRRRQGAHRQAHPRGAGRAREGPAGVRNPEPAAPPLHRALLRQLLAGRRTSTHHGVLRRARPGLARGATPPHEAALQRTAGHQLDPTDDPGSGLHARQPHRAPRPQTAEHLRRQRNEPQSRRLRHLPPPRLHPPALQDLRRHALLHGSRNGRFAGLRLQGGRVVARLRHLRGLRPRKALPSQGRGESASRTVQDDGPDQTCRDPRNPQLLLKGPEGAGEVRVSCHRKLLVRNPEKRPRCEDLLKDKLLVQLMINRINGKESLRQEYPKSIDPPSLSESLLQRQAKSVEDQMKKMEEEVKQKMGALKNKRIDRQQLEDYEREIKNKMKEVERAVRSAFQELHKKGKFADNQKQKEHQQESPSRAKKEESSGIKNTSNSSNFSDATIKSKNFSIKTKRRPAEENESSIDLVESHMLESKPISLKNESNLSCTIQSMMINSKPQIQPPVEDPFEGTIQSEYAATNNDPAVVANAINRLDLLQQTLKKNPQALLSDSFLNCTLSLSQEPQQKKEKQEQKEKERMEVSASLSLELTRQSAPKLPTEPEAPDYYEEDFEEYEENEDVEARRASEMRAMLTLYEQTLAELGGNNSNSSSNKIKNKYLVMSEIKEQSNEGGSMISREDSL